MQALARLRGYGSTSNSESQTQQQQQQYQQPREQQQPHKCEHHVKERGSSTVSPALIFLTLILFAVICLNIGFLDADDEQDVLLRGIGTFWGALAFTSALWCITTDPGSPFPDPCEAPPKTADEAGGAADDVAARQREQRLSDGQIWVQKFCKECKVWRPYGCGHCRYCQRCILQLDHHCIILGTCIGEHNQKFFDGLLLFGGLGLLSWFLLALRCWFVKGWWSHAVWWHYLLLADFTLMSGSCGLVLSCLGFCSFCCRCIDYRFTLRRSPVDEIKPKVAG